MKPAITTIGASVMRRHIGAGNRWYSVTDLIEDDYFDNYTPLKERTS